MLEPASSEEDLRQAIADVRRKATEAHLAAGIETFPIWTVFGPETSDHPGLFVARLWRTLPEPMATNVLLRSSSLDQLRSLLPDGLVRFERSEEDDANIIETWI